MYWVFKLENARHLCHVRVEWQLTSMSLRARSRNRTGNSAIKLTIWTRQQGRGRGSRVFSLQCIIITIIWTSRVLVRADIVWRRSDVSCTVIYSWMTNDCLWDGHAGNMLGNRYCVTLFKYRLINVIRHNDFHDYNIGKTYAQGLLW